MNAIWGARLTTVFAHQGHYASDAAAPAAYAPADSSMDRIGDLPVDDLACARAGKR